MLKLSYPGIQLSKLPSNFKEERSIQHEIEMNVNIFALIKQLILLYHGKKCITKGMGIMHIHADKSVVGAAP